MTIETTQYNSAQKLFVDEKSFTEFYNQYQWFVWKIAYNITFCVDLSHDIRQDVFLKLWIKRNQIDPVQNIKAYIAKYTYMRALNVVGLNKYSTQRNQYFTEGNSQYIDPMNELKQNLCVRK